MSQRRTGHEQFRNLFKNQSREQSSVRIANSSQPGRSRSSSNKKDSGAAKSRRGPKGGAQSSKSSKSGKSIKWKSGGRNKSDSKNSGQRKKGTNQADQESSRKSNGRAKTPARTPQATTPTTPPAQTAGSIPGSPKRKVPSTGAPTKYNGQEVQEKSQMPPTVFENDVNAGQTTTGGGETGGGGAHIKMAEARIKERKLQWKKEDAVRTDPRTDPRQQESSASHNDGDEYEKNYGTGAYGKGEIRHEANNTVKDRTIFENDDGKPAEVKEGKEKLQWAPGAQPPAGETSSEPNVRKKKTGDEPQRAVSDRPPRDGPPVKPPRGIPAMPVRTPVKGSPVALSPAGRAVMINVHSDGPSTNATSITGSVEPKDENVAEKMVSCYIAPTLQHAQFNSAELLKKGAVDSEPYEAAPKPK